MNTPLLYPDRSVRYHFFYLYNFWKADQLLKSKVDKFPGIIYPYKKESSFKMNEVNFERK